MPTTSELALPYPSVNDAPNGASQIGDLASALDTWLGDGWTTYTVTWTGSGSNPAIGNGTLTGRRKYVGDWVDFVIALTAGSTTTYGTGRWIFSLPAAPSVESVVVAYAEDASTSNRYPGAGLLAVSGVVNAVPFGAGGHVGVSSTVPFTWATGDKLLISGRYHKS